MSCVSSKSRFVARVRASAALVAALLATQITACAYKPWTVSAAAAPKPASPIKAESDSATLVVRVLNAQGSGNGGYTVFERGAPVAQFDESIAGWTTTVIKPGLHHFYLRTWTSDFCRRVDANIVAGKVYVLDLNPANTDRPGLLGNNGNIYPMGGFSSDQGKLAGPLYFLPYVRMDDGAAKAELAGHKSQVDKCIQSADEYQAKIAEVYEGGFEQVDFSVSK
jgi:hypothetical protein